MNTKKIISEVAGISFEVRKWAHEIENYVKNYVAKEESQTLEYDFYFNEDKSKLYINECYSNNEAALEHLNNFNQFSEEFFKNIEILKVNMFGPVNDKIRSIFASQNTIFWSKTK